MGEGEGEGEGEGHQGMEGEGEGHQMTEGEGEGSCSWEKMKVRYPHVSDCMGQIREQTILKADHNSWTASLSSGIGREGCSTRSGGHLTVLGE
jgi:hypothetical protein